MSKTVSTSSTPSLPLWQLLSGCADVVAAVRQGQSMTDALADRKATERPGVQALSFAVMRRLGTAQALRTRLVPKAPQPWVDALLLSALSLACGTEYNAHTLVDQAVEAAKRRAKPASGLVNAVLRPLLLLLTLPVTLLTLGLFIFVINGLMFWLAGSLIEGFAVDGFWPAVLGSLLYSVISWALSGLLASGKR